MARRAPFLLPASSLLLCACGFQSDSDASPAKIIVDRLETKLAGQPCIGRLKDWARVYRFPMMPGGRGIDRTEIFFMFREAGRFGYKAGRYIEPAELRFESDERQFRIAYGRYEIGTDKLEIDSCGPSLPDVPVEPDGVIDANSGQIVDSNGQIIDSNSGEILDPGP